MGKKKNKKRCYPGSITPGILELLRKIQTSLRPLIPNMPSRPIDTLASNLYPFIPIACKSWDSLIGRSCFGTIRSVRTLKIREGKTPQLFSVAISISYTPSAAQSPLVASFMVCRTVPTMIGTRTSGASMMYSFLLDAEKDRQKKWEGK